MGLVLGTGTTVPNGGWRNWIILGTSVAGLNEDDIAVTDTGAEMIEIVEIVPTQVLGTLAYYRRWLVDPDGEEVTISWAPMKPPRRSERRHSTRRCRMGAVQEEGRAMRE